MRGLTVGGLVASFSVLSTPVTAEYVSTYTSHSSLLCVYTYVGAFEGERACGRRREKGKRRRIEDRAPLYSPLAPLIFIYHHHYMYIH